MRSSKSRRTSVLMLLAVLISASALLLTVTTVADSKSSLAAPTITSAPGAATSSTSATLAFSGPSGASFKCQLDTAAYAACSSPTSYAGLTAGTHTFGVKAVKGADESAVTSWTWTIDVTPPAAPQLTATPTNPSRSTSPSFSFTDTETGVTYRCSLDSAAYATCTSPTSYAGLGQGSHTFAVVAVDAAGNTSSATRFAWTSDSVAPAAPTLTTRPTDPTSNATNGFAWTSGERGLTFQCSLENGAWFGCSSPYTWVIGTDNYGQHQFAVRAVDAAGNTSGATTYVFKYQKGLPTTGVPFQITGSVTGLTLGGWSPISLTVTNPNSVAIHVSALTVAVDTSVDPVGCASGTNVELQQSNVSASLTLVVPAGASVALPAQGVTRPQIRLRDLPVNQDACKGKSFRLVYSGTANN